MSDDLSSETIRISGRTGRACLGCAREVIGREDSQYALPPSFVNCIHFATVRPPVLCNDIKVGEVSTHKVVSGNACFLVFIHEEGFNGLYECKFKIAPFFSKRMGSGFLLDEVILESITINAKIDYQD